MSEYATLDDFRVEKEPQTVRAGEFGKVKIKQMPYGDVEERFPKDFNDDEVETEELVDLISDYVVKPDMSVITVENVRSDFHPMSIARLTKAIMKVNGFNVDVEVDEQGNAKVTKE